jgi:hypothetical protein
MRRIQIGQGTISRPVNLATGGVLSEMNFQRFSDFHRLGPDEETLLARLSPGKDRVGSTSTSAVPSTPRAVCHEPICAPPLVKSSIMPFQNLGTRSISS